MGDCLGIPDSAGMDSDIKNTTSLPYGDLAILPNSNCKRLQYKVYTGSANEAATLFQRQFSQTYIKIKY